jgi:acyl-CoA synthetase (AMP-forming)/AMP-acid ligase II
MVEHQQLASYTASIEARLDLPTGASFATVSTFAADLGHTCIFPSLCSGGCLHVIETEHIVQPDKFASYCHDHPIDCLKIVPSHLAALLQAEDASSVLPRRLLVLGGEAPPHTLLRHVYKLAPKLRVLNHYGPTEATVGAAQPVPIGVKGEICIGGSGVARGYLNRPELTAERFALDPFSTVAGARLYRTGDLGRYLPDGTVELLGRSDDQVKIRGFRVEPDEITALLKQHPAIYDAVVLPYEARTDEKQLAAYIVFKPDWHALSSELQSYLQAQLPSYMVPVAFVTVAMLPLTPNGKLDRRALPPPDQAASVAPTSLAPPRTRTEELLVQIWTEALGTSAIGVHDNFFALGGHSLLATRVIARVHAQFGVDLFLRTFFEAPILTDLAAKIERLQQEGTQQQGSSPVEIRVQRAAREAHRLARPRQSP